MSSTVEVKGIPTGYSVGVGNNQDPFFDVAADVKLRNQAGERFQVDAGLDDVQLGNLEGKPFQVDAGLDDIRVKELPTIELRVALTEIPKVRAHVPLHYDLSISLFGFELLSFALCGESQVITEDYVPRRPEKCR
jgi:hypothetical protein